MLNLKQRGVSAWAIIIVLAFMVAAIIIAFWPQIDVPEENIGPAHIRLWNKARGIAGNLDEKVKIEKWITDNKLNQYGVPASTLYAGGTPLFDESTGKTMDRYEYIKMNHPAAPWIK